MDIFSPFRLFSARSGSRAKVRKADIEAIRGFFDADHYRRQEKGLETLSERALAEHFLSEGWTRGLDPSPTFSVSDYLEINTDVAKAGINPLLHYIRHGRDEGRRVSRAEPVRLTVSADARFVPEHLDSVLLHTGFASTSVTPPERFDTAAMTIHWVIPDFARGGGGHMTIFRMVRFLETFGHRCCIWIEKPHLHASSTEARADIINDFQPVEADVRFVEEGLAEATGDAVIATHWTSAYIVDALNGFAAKFYFIQDHEPEFYPTGAESLLARRTYGFDLACICASPWLERMMVDRYGRWARHFYLAYDHDTYRPIETAGERDPISGNAGRKRYRIAVYARMSTPRRCVSLTLAALRALAQERDDFEVHFYGQEYLPFAETNFTAYNHGVLKDDELARLYNACDIGICFSATNYSLVPQEMIACGLPLVELDTECTRTIFPDGVVTLTGPDPHDIARTVGALLDDAEGRARQSAAARDWVEAFDWEKSARTVEAAIREYMER